MASVVVMRGTGTGRIAEEVVAVGPGAAAGLCWEVCHDSFVVH